MGVGPTSLGNIEAFPVVKPVVAAFFNCFHLFCLAFNWHCLREWCNWPFKVGHAAFLKAVGPAGGELKSHLVGISVTAQGTWHLLLGSCDKHSGVRFLL